MQSWCDRVTRTSVSCGEVGNWLVVTLVPHKAAPRRAASRTLGNGLQLFLALIANNFSSPLKCSKYYAFWVVLGYKFSSLTCNF